MYQWEQDTKKHAEIFYKYMDKAIQEVNNPDIQNYLKFAKAYADTRFNLDRISSQWESLMVELREQYPTTESRKLPAEMFTYRT